LVAERNGHHWFGALGGRLAWGYGFLVPYATGASHHLDFGQSLLSNDRGRQAPFDPRDGIRALPVAVPLGGRFREYTNLSTLDRDAQMLVCATYRPSLWRGR